VKKGKRDKYSSFVGLERRIIFQCPEFRQLSPRAITLYLHIKAKFNGGNNGQIAFHYREIKGAKGFRSDKAISAALKELSPDWVERTKIGGLYRYQNLYRLTGRFDKFGIS
jgi:hypothetical protein